MILKPDSRERLCSSQVLLQKSQMKLYVGNLSFETTENDLRDLFAEYGTVTDVAILNDRETGRSRGFGFVTFSDATGGNAAVEALNGKEVSGRALTVNEAREREERPRQFAGGGNRR